MGPVYEFLGLTVGLVQHDMRHEDRQNAYMSDVTYVTNNEVGFDYLRDNMVVRREDRAIMRGFNYAIIDEVDFILIDEARTPLIISGPAEESTEKYSVINRLIPSLKGRKITESEEIDAKYKEIDLTKGYDFIIDEKGSSVTLTSQGVSKCENLLQVLIPVLSFLYDWRLPENRQSHAALQHQVLSRPRLNPCFPCAWPPRPFLAHPLTDSL